MKIASADRAELLSILDRFPQQRIVLLGDLVADEFIQGEISRVSREAPVLILKQRSKRVLPGGGANAANNLVDLGARVILAGAVGEDEAGEALLGYFRDKGVPARGVLRLRGEVTPTKSRVLGVLSHGHPQQIVRVDREPATKRSAGIRRRIALTVRACLDKVSGVLVSDYGYGAADAVMVRALQGKSGQRKRESGSPVWTVDSRYDMLDYERVTAMTPNEPELEAAFRQRIGDSLELLNRLGSRLLRRQRLEALVVTRGRRGMVLFEGRRQPRYLDIFGSDQVADVTGAGDTVIATLTLALAARASFLHAAMIANCAGGLVVMKRGTATVTRDELAVAIRNA